MGKPGRGVLTRLPQAALIAAVAWSAGCAAQAVPAPKQVAAPARAEPKLAPSELLKRGRAALAASRYEEADRLLRQAIEQPPIRSAALRELAELELLTGRYEQALRTARLVPGASAEHAEAVAVAGEALRRQGQLEAAEAELRQVEQVPEARSARLLLGEVLLERGERERASEVLMTLIEDYNSDRLPPEDGRSLALVGRAAHLLRSPHDANDAFNEAESKAPGDVRTLLWRAELFLDKYDPGHAEEVLREVLSRAPEHPEANVWMAHVKLAQALDFDEAERLAQKALKVNPELGSAYFVLAGIALRDMELGLAEQRLERGLRVNPRDLELLSLRATARFLADDEPGFQAAKAAVLQHNPEYTRMYQIIGEYADWEHRYDEIVSMMREAVRIDAEDAKAHAQLGLNLIRAGDDAAALPALRQAFAQDPFNVRVYNTLNLYEQVIPKDYVTVKHGLFTIRYHREERDILERYVPDLLERAFRKMVEGYGFTPQTPIGIELYAERQNFAVRTSGLPQTAIQGVCFGRTLAAMSPKQENFNLGMTLWHELAHVFHIQRSRSRVPRWFTEGLAEYETLIERTEWAREHDPDLYEAVRSGKLPKLTSMSRAFTRAEEMSDIATAYYASSQVLVMMGEQYGRPKLSHLMQLWGEGKPTAAAIQEALGTDPERLDADFHRFLEPRLARYRQQFVPMSRVGSVARASEAAEREPKDVQKLTAYAVALLRSGEAAEADRVVKRALALDARYPDARWMVAELARVRQQPKVAVEVLEALIRDGHDGYQVQLALADHYQALGDASRAQAALLAAHALDPSQSEPVHKLAALAEQAQDKAAELDLLRKLARLEQHAPRVYRRLLELLLEQRAYAEAVEVGQAAIMADIEGLETHTLFAEALGKAGDVTRARYELESALLCPGRPAAKAEVLVRLADLELSQGKRAVAARHLKEARKLDPGNPRLEQLTP